MIAGMSQGIPTKCTTDSALVRGVMARSSASGVQLRNEIVTPAPEGAVEHDAGAVVAVRCARIDGIEHAQARKDRHSRLQRGKVRLPAIEIFGKPAELRASKRRLHFTHPVIETERGDVVHSRNAALGVRAIHAEGPQARDRRSHVAML